MGKSVIGYGYGLIARKMGNTIIGRFRTQSIRDPGIQTCPNFRIPLKTVKLET
ncbi:hypothetical protein [Ohtaekwangia koreensis]|uniref:hypothetical protein n=1 Tax=Ohtaekwangia koreensis TaxID=688867 RepID=UPI0013564BCD|nr:hypothetical protein [Ohtaekwangia koreensis]